VRLGRADAGGGGLIISLHAQNKPKSFAGGGVTQAITKVKPGL